MQEFDVYRGSNVWVRIPSGGNVKMCGCEVGSGGAAMFVRPVVVQYCASRQQLIHVVRPRYSRDSGWNCSEMMVTKAHPSRRSRYANIYKKMYIMEAYLCQWETINQLTNQSPTKKIECRPFPFFSLFTVYTLLFVVSLFLVYMRVSGRLFVLQIKSENSFWSKDMILARKFQQNLTKRQNEGGEAAANLRYIYLWLSVKLTRVFPTDVRAISSDYNKDNQTLDRPVEISEE